MKSNIALLVLAFAIRSSFADDTLTVGRWYSEPHYSQLYDGDAFLQIELLEDGKAFFRLFSTSITDYKKEVYEAMKILGVYSSSEKATTLRLPETGQEFDLSLSEGFLLVRSLDSKSDSVDKLTPEQKASWAKPIAHGQFKKAEQDAAANP